MSRFDQRWRRLVRAATAAGEEPFPHAPDGARLQRLPALGTSGTGPCW